MLVARPNDRLSPADTLNNTRFNTSFYYMLCKEITCSIDRAYEIATKENLSACFTHGLLLNLPYY